MKAYKEVWKDYPAANGHIRISNYGRVISTGRFSYDMISGEYKWKPARLIAKPKRGRYQSISFTKDGESVTVPLHRAVAELFIPNPHGLPVVNHIDGEKSNNAVDNLEWCTASENTLHAYRTGLASAEKAIRGKRRAQYLRAEERRNNPTEYEKLIMQGYTDGQARGILARRETLAEYIRRNYGKAQGFT